MAKSNKVEILMCNTEQQLLLCGRTPHITTATVWLLQAVVFPWATRERRAQVEGCGINFPNMTLNIFLLHLRLENQSTNQKWQFHPKLLMSWHIRELEAVGYSPYQSRSIPKGKEIQEALNRAGKNFRDALIQRSPIPGLRAAIITKELWICKCHQPHT